jgi:hypothetical protein
VQGQNFICVTALALKWMVIMMLFPVKNSGAGEGDFVSATAMFGKLFSGTHLQKRCYIGNYRLYPLCFYITLFSLLLLQQGQEGELSVLRLCKY